MRAAPATLKGLIKAHRRPGESRNAHAKRLKFSEGTLRYYENGGLPRTNTVPALARALGKPEADVLALISKPHARKATRGVA